MAKLLIELDLAYCIKSRIAQSALYDNSSVHKLSVNIYTIYTIYINNEGIMSTREV